MGRDDGSHKEYVISLLSGRIGYTPLFIDLYSKERTKDQDLLKPVTSWIFTKSLVERE